MNEQEIKALITENLDKCYVYIIFDDNNVPFYVGKGTKRRILEHVRLAKKGVTTVHRLALIKQILDKGNEISYEIDSWHDDHDSAYHREKELIELYGRRDLDTGTLTNKDSGGKGVMNPNKKTREKMSLAKKGRMLSDAHKSSISKGNMNRIVSPETRRKISDSNKGQKRSEETRRKQSESAKLSGSKRWDTRRSRYGASGGNTSQSAKKGHETRRKKVK